MPIPVGGALEVDVKPPPPLLLRYLEKLKNIIYSGNRKLVVAAHSSFQDIKKTEGSK